ncbi:hypothetical protein EG832_02970 [bacterium]|nr:hypothetical protein [bacterium]
MDALYWIIITWTSGERKGSTERTKSVSFDELDELIATTMTDELKKRAEVVITNGQEHCYLDDWIWIRTRNGASI